MFVLAGPPVTFLQPDLVEVVQAGALPAFLNLIL
jgi:hypothetical protein